jgi:hypothetical protein
MRCDTCKHWTPHDIWQAPAGGLRKCAAVRELWDVQDEVPEKIKEGRDDARDAADGLHQTPDEKVKADEYAAACEAVFSKAKAVVNDGSQYMAELLTRPDFGCVLHAPNE